MWLYLHAVKPVQLILHDASNGQYMVNAGVVTSIPDESCNNNWFVMQEP